MTEADVQKKLKLLRTRVREFNIAVNKELADIFDEITTLEYQYEVMTKKKASENIAYEFNRERIDDEL